MRNTKIEWCTMSWNPVTGCLHGCQYCYARRIANRFASKDPAAVIETANCKSIHVVPELNRYKGKVEPYPFGFQPTFHSYRLEEPARTKKPQVIFVCSMADLFGRWVPDEWIAEVFNACLVAPQHKYLFLTKNPDRYDELIDKGLIRAEYENFWLGSIVPDMTVRAHWNNKNHTFWSCEPLMRPWPCGEVNRANAEYFPEWVILGAGTGNRKGKVVPKKRWIDNIVETCRLMGAKIFMKDSLVPIVGEEAMLREFPEGIK